MKKIIYMMVALICLSFASAVTPEEVTNVNATISGNRINLSWVDVADETYYKVCKSSTFSFASNNCEQITTTKYSDAGNEPRLYYLIVSGNAAGETLSSKISVKENYTFYNVGFAYHRSWKSFYFNDSRFSNAIQFLALHPNIQVIQRYNPDVGASGTWQACMYDGWCPVFLCDDTQCNFNITTDRGYEIDTDVDYPISLFLGGVIQPPKQISLIGNRKNFIGMTPQYQINASAKNLMDGIGVCDKVTKWDNLIQEYVYYLPAGTDFNLVTQEAYQVNITSNTNWYNGMLPNVNYYNITTVNTLRMVYTSKDGNTVRTEIKAENKGGLISKAVRWLNWVIGR